MVVFRITRSCIDNYQGTPIAKMRIICCEYVSRYRLGSKLYEASGLKPPTLDGRFKAAAPLELTAYASG